MSSGDEIRRMERSMNEVAPYPYGDETPEERRMGSPCLIWWVSQANAERMGYPASKDEVDDSYLEEGYFWREDTDLPDYIFSQLLSRYGRPARGRLWVPPDIEIDDLDVDDAESDLVRRLIVQECNDCGGIVFKAQDLKFVRKYPGFITDLEYNKV
jgi:hypothetical protein